MKIDEVYSFKYSIYTGVYDIVLRELALFASHMLLTNKCYSLFK